MKQKKNIMLNLWEFEKSAQWECDLCLSKMRLWNWEPMKNVYTAKNESENEILNV